MWTFATAKSCFVTSHYKLRDWRVSTLFSNCLICFSKSPRPQCKDTLHQVACEHQVWIPKLDHSVENMEVSILYASQAKPRHVYANGLETVRVKWHIFKLLRNGLLRYMLYTSPNMWCNSCGKCYGMDCFGTYFTHVQTCDVTRVQSGTEWTASVHTLHMSKPVM